MATQSQWIDATISSLLEIEQLMSVSFGPNFKAVLIQKQSGPPVITSSGLEILQSVEFNSSFAKIVTNGAEKMHCVLGDGVKTFIFLLLELVQRCKKSLNGCAVGDGIRVSRQLQHFADTVLPSAVITEAFMKHCQVNCTQTQPWSNILKVWKTVIQTHLQTKFPVLVSRTLVDILYRFLTATCHQVKDLDFLLNNFKLLCLEVYQRSVTESVIIEGFVVTKEMVVEAESVALNFVMWKISFSSRKNDKGYTIVVQNEKDRMDLLTGDSCNFEKILDLYQSHFGIKLIISKDCLLSYMLFICKKKNISVIHGVLDEEIDYISNTLQMVPVTDLSETLTTNKVETVVSAQKLNIGSHSYVKLRFSKCPTLKQVVVCGPTDSICKQYSRECLNCIRILTAIGINHDRVRDNAQTSVKMTDCNIQQHAVQGVNCKSELCTDFGDEIKSHNESVNVVNELEFQLNNDVSPVGSTTAPSDLQQLRGKFEDLKVCSEKHSTVSDIERLNHHHLIAVPCCGHFEYVLYYVLLNSCLFPKNEINTLVAESTLAIPRKLHALSVRKASARSFLLEKTKILERISRGECCSNDVVLDTVESLFVKQTVLETAIRTASMIFSIGGEQRIRRLRDVTLRSNETEDSDD